jgi:uncharacterized membrane protein YfcA
MPVAEVVRMVVLGLTAGVVGGMFGIGGGLIMVPALILLFGFEQRHAIGTSLLAQLLPVGILGVAEYWGRGEVRVGAGLAMAGGLLFGAWAGGYLTGVVPKETAKQLYGGFLLLVGMYFLFWPSTPGKKPAGAGATPPGAAAPAEGHAKS